MTKILQTLEDLPPGYVFNKIFKNRFEKNKNVLFIAIGSTGSGKSYVCMRICEDWYKYYFNREFPINNVCFSIAEAVKLINSGKLKKGEIIIIEEAGVLLNSLDFQNKINKFFGFLMQSFRSKNIGILFNTPVLGFLGKTQRSLLHGIIETVAIDYQKKQTIVKLKGIQTSSIYDKSYFKFFKIKRNDKIYKIERLLIEKPSDNLILEYEKKKDEFVNKIAKQLEEATDEEQEYIDDFMYSAVEELKNKGFSLNEIQKIIGFRTGLLRKINHELSKKRAIEVLEKVRRGELIAKKILEKSKNENSENGQNAAPISQKDANEPDPAKN